MAVSRGSARLAALALLLATAIACGAIALTRDPVGPIPPQGFEALRAEAAYLTSAGCAPCHRERARSWERTFHRTMTQRASAAAIRAPFDGRPLDWLGVRTVPRMGAGGGHEIETTHPATGRPGSFPVVMTVGSRRMQQFVTRMGDRHVRLPVAYSIEEGRWFHLSEAFFHPDGEPFHQPTALWDLNCIFCHNVKARPGFDPDGAGTPEWGLPGRVDSAVAELGIACEACHGPGEEHARRMHSPLRRLAFDWSERPDPTIVHPERLDRRRSAQVCGHCHGQRLPARPGDILSILGEGDPYTAGEDLARYYVPVTAESRIGSQPLAPRFWRDGSPRLTAYEYQGLVASACFVRGEMTCLSCHAMHAGDPHGQLRPDRPGDALCTQCHAGYTGEALAAHTHHKPEGEGSRCTSCHMPREVYGIMSWHPSHLIRSPDPRESAATGKPDACTLCHSGRSRRWAAERTEAWWPEMARQPDVERHQPAEKGAVGRVPARVGIGFEELPEAPEMIRALYAGDVVYRTLAAARLAAPSPEPGVGAAAVAFLAELLLDPYPNVRRTARNALAALTGDGGLPFALAPQAERSAAADRLAAGGLKPPGEASWPLTADGRPDRGRLEAWRSERVEVEVAIGE